MRTGVLMLSLLISTMKNLETIARMPSHVTCMIIIAPVARVNAINIVAFDAAIVAKSSLHSISSLSPLIDIPDLHIPAQPASSSTLYIILISSFISSSQLPSS